jgi:hypothetical protein
MSVVEPKRPTLSLKRPVTLVLPPELRPKACAERPAPKAQATEKDHRNMSMPTLTARSLKVSLVLDPAEVATLAPSNAPQVTLKVAVAGRTLPPTSPPSHCARRSPRSTRPGPMGWWR